MVGAKHASHLPWILKCCEINKITQAESAPPSCGTEVRRVRLQFKQIFIKKNERYCGRLLPLSGTVPSHFVRNDNLFCVISSLKRGWEICNFSGILFFGETLLGPRFGIAVEGFDTAKGDGRAEVKIVKRSPDLTGGFAQRALLLEIQVQLQQVAHTFFVDDGWQR